MSNYEFIPLDQYKIKVPAVKGRFAFIDKRSRTVNSTDIGASDKPMGIYYYDNELGSTVNAGWIQYYNYNYPDPVYLELASGVSVDSLIDFVPDGRGVPANRNGTVYRGYARAIETGNAGELIQVLVVYQNQRVTHAFSTGFDYYEFE